MSIIYRSEKGSPLTTHEIDGNFKELEERLNALIDHQEVREALGKIDVVGDQISFTGTFGTHFGTFTLPKALLNPCGSWTTQTPYKKLDFVTFENALYCCLKDHISTTWTEDSLFWKLFLNLPHAPDNFLSLYEKASLPEKEKMGQIALLLENEGPSLIFFNGNQWQRLMKGETL